MDQATGRDLSEPAGSGGDAPQDGPVNGQAITIQAVAKICHEANKALCEGLHDFSQFPWELAPGVAAVERDGWRAFQDEQSDGGGVGIT